MSVTIKRKSSSKKKSIKKFITRKRNNKIRKHTIKRGGGNGGPKVKTQQPVSSLKSQGPGGPTVLRRSPVLRHQILPSPQLPPPRLSQGPQRQLQLKASVRPDQGPPVPPLLSQGPPVPPRLPPRLPSSQQNPPPVPPKMQRTFRNFNTTSEKQIFGNPQKVLQESTKKEPVYAQIKNTYLEKHPFKRASSPTGSSKSNDSGIDLGPGSSYIGLGPGPGSPSPSGISPFTRKPAIKVKKNPIKKEETIYTKLKFNGNIPPTKSKRFSLQRNNNFRPFQTSNVTYASIDPEATKAAAA